MSLALFLIIAAIAVLFALGVVVAQRIMHAVLALGGMLLAVASIFATLGATFLAVIQVLVYAGGVVVLLLFATMLTRSDLQLKREPSDDVKPAAAAVFGIAMLFYLATNNWNAFQSAQAIGGVEEVGMVIFDINKGVIPFEVVSLVLLAAMVGAIFLGRKEAEK